MSIIVDKITLTLQASIIKLIRAYQLVISPFLGERCLFYPSCSCYTQEAIKVHGLISGLLLGCKRILRCHPISEGGIDLVPVNLQVKNNQKQNEQHSQK